MRCLRRLAFICLAGHEVRVELEDEPGITEQRIHARVA
jgi:hypothetical protein